MWNPNKTNQESEATAIAVHVYVCTITSITIYRHHRHRHKRRRRHRSSSLLSTRFLSVPLSFWRDRIAHLNKLAWPSHWKNESLHSLPFLAIRNWGWVWYGLAVLPSRSSFSFYRTFDEYRLKVNSVSQWHLKLNIECKRYIIFFFRFRRVTNSLANDFFLQ